VAGIPAKSTLDADRALGPAGRAEALGTLECPMALLGADGTVLILLEGSVQQRQFAKLSLLVNVLLVVDHHEHLLNEPSGLVELDRVVAGN